MFIKFTDVVLDQLTQTVQQQSALPSALLLKHETRASDAVDANQKPLAGARRGGTLL